MSDKLWIQATIDVAEQVYKLQRDRYLQLKRMADSDAVNARVHTLTTYDASIHDTALRKEFYSWVRQSPTHGRAGAAVSTRNKIEAIMHIRQYAAHVMGIRMGLKEAKDFVDAHY